MLTVSSFKRLKSDEYLTPSIAWKEIHLLFPTLHWWEPFPSKDKKSVEILKNVQ